MEITLEKYLDWNIVSIDGDFVMRELARVRQCFDSIADSRKLKIAFDLSHTRLVDSSAIGFIVAQHSRIAESQGDAAIMGCSSDVLEVIMITGLQKIVTIYDTRAAFERAIANGKAAPDSSDRSKS